MAIFNSYVKLPEGIGFQPSSWRGISATIHSRFIVLTVHIAFMCLLLFNVHMVDKFILPFFGEFGDGLWFFGL